MLQGRTLVGSDGVELLACVRGLAFSLGEGSIARLLALDAIGFSCQALLLCCSGGGIGRGGWRRGPNHRGVKKKHCYNVTISISVWANHGDAISTQYSGTPALKGDFVR
ncbi:hypothetical protein PR202_gb16088 [Eleusine coracana subsp. coracana]|uniref:Uncharacterized protein n=1 Tax=Eleusine coracana subsp. coracana TaxID=191504 RepID=A0AAV5EZK9_ELECO|nr:hypothetical protein PR202_gb16088 [Eleusine coracana subsp. coracana]